MITVPEKTIVAVPLDSSDCSDIADVDLSTFIRPLNIDHQRDWFTPNFYKCLPLAIGNMQGFVFSVPYDFEVFWNGGMNGSDIEIRSYITSDLDAFNMKNVYLSSGFGNGILTMHFPVALYTPPGVNLITIAPPNYPTPGISPMTGVIETDNLRFSFTLNFKIDLPNTVISFKKDYPIIGILPIPRYFCDSFNLINAKDIIDKKTIKEEQEIYMEHSQRRLEQNNIESQPADLLYYKGMDIRRNKFKDHQVPKRNKQ